MNAISPLPNGVFSVRSSLCRHCPTPCAHQHNTEHTGAVCATCPLPRRRWGPYGKCRPAFGLGDAVATVAEPIARFSDAVLGTKLVGCSACAERRAALNALVPDVTKPTG
jgi:hypothetical protein